MVASQDADPSGDDVERNSSSVGEPNPFAPVAMSPGGTLPRSAGNPLSAQFWGFLVVLLVASAALIFVMPFWGVALLAATIMSGIRVPLLLRRLAQKGSGATEPSSSTLLLFTSMLLNLAMGGASLVAFVVICLPAGFLSFTLFETTTAEASILTFVFGGSGLIALGVYFMLFRLSLRLNA